MAALLRKADCRPPQAYSSVAILKGMFINIQINKTEWPARFSFLLLALLGLRGDLGGFELELTGLNSPSCLRICLPYIFKYVYI